jgi:hypothetical protein
LISFDIFYFDMILTTPYDTQGIRKIETLFNPGNQMTYKLVEASWQRSMVESGLGKHFLTKDGSKLAGIITDGWITNLWHFVNENNIVIRRLDNKHERCLWNKNDSFIMEDVCTGIKWTIEEKQKINYCRIYLGVELLSDIITADGRTIRRNMWKGTFDKSNVRFVKPFYCQQRPGETAWSIRRKLLKTTYQCNDQGVFNVRKPAIMCTMDWVWHYHPPTDRIYKKVGDSWEVRSRMQ